jgi:AhpD family alkylhydroperoxidase
MRWHVADKASGEIALNTTNEVVVFGVATFRDDAECVVFHHRGARDASEETLLHAAFEAKDRNLRGRLQK